MERVPRLQCRLQGLTDKPGEMGKTGGKGSANTRGEISESLLRFNRFKKKKTRDVLQELKMVKEEFHQVVTS